ncbi:MAG TPA: hypothetical protein VEI97_15700 [bacterium]|nr:hypothetical protein [bacterium]
MSAQRIYGDPRRMSAMPAYEQLPGGYGSPNTTPAVQATVVQVATSAPHPMLVPRSHGAAWTWPLGGALATLALAGALQMAALSAEHRLKDIELRIADSRAMLVQERNAVAESLRLRNELAAVAMPDTGLPLEDAVIYLPAEPARTRLASYIPPRSR